MVHDDNGREGIRVIARDQGPGIENLEQAMQDGYTSGGGLGLGLFIAKTLLERSGAALAFGNGDPGAMVEVSWPLARIRADGRAALGENPSHPA